VSTKTANYCVYRLSAFRQDGGMTKQNTTARPWTAAEDAILGTNTLVKIAANLNRPTSQIQKRMKQLGVRNR
jgi:hypothetical protein